MKIKSIYIAGIALATAGLLTGCSSDYLDVAPKTDVSDTSLGDPSVAKGLVDGMYEAMNTQYSRLSMNNTNVGEASINMFCGELCGMDYNSAFLPNYWTSINLENGYVVLYPWMYYYNIINQANYLIKAIPGTGDSHENVDSELLFYKAQAYTMRAHGYTKLLQFFGQRWEDSDNGEAYCIVLRTEPGTDPTPLVTMNEVFKVIYEDCDNAVKLYEACGMQRSNMWEANADVANGIWARAALIKHDWRTAAVKAAAARKAYTIMDDKDLYNGYVSQTSETMWSMNPDFVTTYYWSWGSLYSCNGAYVENWDQGAGAINIDLYNKLDANDKRRAFFWMPDKLKAIRSSQNPGKIKESDFWNPKMVNELNFLNMSSTNIYNKKDKQGFGMLNVVAYWLNDYYLNVFTGDRNLIANKSGLYNLCTIKQKSNNNKRDVRFKLPEGGSHFVEPFPVQFGAQCKFWSIQPYGNMEFPWMRASEMALTEAEAYYHLNEPGKAITALSAVQSKRIPNYSCNKSGDQLLDEIRTARRIELWGEGFNFTDIKRWNIERTRRVWVAEDVTSGNVPKSEWSGYDEAGMRKLSSTKYCNGWRFTIPAYEYRYNDAIDLGKLKVISND